MTAALLLLRAFVWLVFILPICARMIFTHGDILAAIMTAAFLGTLAHLATLLPEDETG